MVAPTSCLSGTQLSAASPQRRPRTSAAGDMRWRGWCCRWGPHHQAGTPTGVTLVGLHQHIPTPMCPTRVMEAVTGVGSNAVGCHQVKRGWEVV